MDYDPKFNAIRVLKRKYRSKDFLDLVERFLVGAILSADKSQNVQELIENFLAQLQIQKGDTSYSMYVDLFLEIVGYDELEYDDPLYKEKVLTNINVYFDFHSDAIIQSINHIKLIIPTSTNCYQVILGYTNNLGPKLHPSKRYKLIEQLSNREAEVDESIREDFKKSIQRLVSEG